MTQGTFYTIVTDENVSDELAAVIKFLQEFNGNEKPDNSSQNQEGGIDKYNYFPLDKQTKV